MAEYTAEEELARDADELAHDAWMKARAEDALAAAVDLLELAQEASLNVDYVMRQAADLLGLDRTRTRSTIRRRPIGRAVTRQVWDRDGWECRRCGTHRDLTIDHVTPLALGGTDEICNLQTLCSRCNSSKGARQNAEPQTVNGGA